MTKVADFLVLGCGNMAQALVQGMAQSDSSLKFLTYTPSGTKAQLLAEKVDGQVLHQLDALPTTDYIMIACKPQQFSELAKEIKGKLSSDVVIVSILAGVSTERIERELGHTNIIRIMPNTPALVGAGVNAFYFCASINDQTQNNILKLFKNFSEVFSFTQEEHIDLITPYSGCGPAYYFELSRILTEHLIAKGIDRNTASQLVKATAFGSGKLLNESSQSAEELRDKVTSKGGVTFAALESLKQSNLERIVEVALESAHNRNKELASE